MSHLQSQKHFSGHHKHHKSSAICVVNMATIQRGLFILRLGGIFCLIFQPQQTADPWCVQVRPAWCLEILGSAPLSTPNQTGHPSGENAKRNKIKHTGQVMWRKRYQEQLPASETSPWTGPGRSGRTSCWPSLSRRSCPPASPAPSA